MKKIIATAALALTTTSAFAGSGVDHDPEAMVFKYCFRSWEISDGEIAKTPQCMNALLYANWRK